MTPHKFTDMGDKAVRTVRMSFPAPPGPGLYTFQAYVMSDSFVGTDVQKDLRVRSLLPRRFSCLEQNTDMAWVDRVDEGRTSASGWSRSR